MDVGRYIDLFLSEARDHLRSSEDLLGSLESDPQHGESLRNLFRHVHSIKGMAGTMGFEAMVDVSHALEELLEVSRGAPPELSGAVDLSMIWESLACMTRIIEAITMDRPAADGQARPLARRLRSAAADLAEQTRSVDGRAVREFGGDGSEHPSPTGISPQQDAVRVALRDWQVRATLPAGRVGDASRAVRLVGRLGEIGRVVRITPPLCARRPEAVPTRIALAVRTGRSREELEHELSSIPQLERFSVECEEAAKASTRPAEPPRTSVRVRADLLDSVMATAMELALALEDAAIHTSDGEDSEGFRRERCRSLSKNLYRTLVEIRMVPFDTVTRRLVAGVRDLSTRLGKRVRFTIEGGSVRLDRSILEALIDPLLHIVRNAIGHGIESLETRIDLGKPGPGRVDIRLGRSHDRVRIAVRDDGRGLDPEELRRTAIERGFLSEPDASRLSDSESYLLATLPGFSTADRTTTLSGRGVGLDVVRGTVERLGGRLRIESEPGQGTTFLLELPQTLTVIQALLVRTSERLYAVPVSAVERTVAVDRDAIRSENGRDELVDLDRVFEVCRLEDRLDVAPRRAMPGRAAAALVPAVRPDLAVVVDEIVGRREVLVRPLEPPLLALPQFTGAALLDDGSVALVVDPDVLTVPG